MSNFVLLVQRLKTLLLVCLVTGGNPVFAQLTGEDSNIHTPGAEELAWEEWGNSAWIALANSETTWIRAALATHLATRTDPDLAALGHHLLESLAELPTDNGLALWHLARYCMAFKSSPSCERHQIIERMAKANAGNLAALLVVDQYQSGEKWSGPDPESTENHELIRQLAGAGYYDDFWGRGTGDLLSAFETFSSQVPPPEIPGTLKELNVSPALILLFPVYSMEGYSPGFSKLSNLCEAIAVSGNKDAIQHCLAVAATLQQKSRTQLSVMIGLAIEESVLAAALPGSPAASIARQKRTAFRKSSQCTLPRLMTRIARIELAPVTIEQLSNSYLLDLDKLGELQANRRAAEREYTLFPDQFPSNPQDCPDVLTMSGTEITEYLGEADPVAEPVTL